MTIHDEPQTFPNVNPIGMLMEEPSMIWVNNRQEEETLGGGTRMDCF